MKTITTFVSISIAHLALASPAIVEESLRATLSGATDLVPTIYPKPESRTGQKPYKITLHSSDPPEFTGQNKDSPKGVFIPEERIELPAMSSILNESE